MDIKEFANDLTGEILSSLKCYGGFTVMDEQQAAHCLELQFGNPDDLHFITELEYKVLVSDEEYYNERKAAVSKFIDNLDVPPVDDEEFARTYDGEFVGLPEEGP